MRCTLSVRPSVYPPHAYNLLEMGKPQKLQIWWRRKLDTSNYNGICIIISC